MRRRQGCVLQLRTWRRPGLCRLRRVEQCRRPCAVNPGMPLVGPSINSLADRLCHLPLTSLQTHSILLLRGQRFPSLLCLCYRLNARGMHLASKRVLPTNSATTSERGCDMQERSARRRLAFDKTARYAQGPDVKHTCLSWTLHMESGALPLDSLSVPCRPETLRTSHSSSWDRGLASWEAAKLQDWTQQHWTWPFQPFQHRMKADVARIVGVLRAREWRLANPSLCGTFPN